MKTLPAEGRGAEGKKRQKAAQRARTSGQVFEEPANLGFSVYLMTLRIGVSEMSAKRCQQSIPMSTIWARY